MRIRCQLVISKQDDPSFPTKTRHFHTGRSVISKQGDSSCFIISMQEDSSFPEKNHCFMIISRFIVVFMILSRIIVVRFPCRRCKLCSTETKLRSKAIELHSTKTKLCSIESSQKLLWPYAWFARRFVCWFARSVCLDKGRGLSGQTSLDKHICE